MTKTKINPKTLEAAPPFTSVASLELRTVWLLLPRTHKKGFNSVWIFFSFITEQIYRTYLVRVILAKGVEKCMGMREGQERMHLFPKRLVRHTFRKIDWILYHFTVAHQMRKEKVSSSILTWRQAAI